MSPKKILSLGKFIDDAYEQYIKKGGKKNKKTFLKEDINKKKLDDKKPKFTKKDYEKSLVDKFGKGTSLVSLNKNIKNIAEKSLKKKDKPKLDNKKTFTKKEYEKSLVDNLKKPNQKTKTTVGSNKTKTTTGSNKTKTTAGVGASAGAKKTSQNILNKQKQSFLKRNKGKIAGGLGVLALTPALIDTKDSETKAKENKLDKKLKNIKPKVNTSKITKPTTAKVKKQTLPKTKANDYTGKYIDKDGNVAYESFSDFIAHMSGKPKKRAMPEKTKRIIGEGKKLKRIKPETKGAGKGVKYKAFKEGTKDKTVGKPMSPKDALKKKFSEATDMNFLINTLGLKKPTRKRTMVEKIFGGSPDEAYTLKKGRAKIASKNQARKDLKKEYPELMKRVTKKSAGKTVGLKPLPPKSKNPGIHKLPAKTKINMGFKPMFGGGFISSLYDKPEKTEKYKGNTTSARQVKGYGKAKKKA